jgi:hypothetical protein
MRALIVAWARRSTPLSYGVAGPGAIVSRSAGPASAISTPWLRTGPAAGKIDHPQRSCSRGKR